MPWWLELHTLKSSSMHTQKHLLTLLWWIGQLFSILGRNKANHPVRVVEETILQLYSERSCCSSTQQHPMGFSATLRLQGFKIALTILAWRFYSWSCQFLSLPELDSKRYFWWVSGNFFGCQDLWWLIVLLMWLCARLEKLGGPKEAGEILLHRFIAPEGSNKVANLVNAERRDDMGVVFYTLEFIVEGPAFSRHNVAVYATSGGELFSLNAQSPKALWPNVQNQFREMANSFRLLR